MKKIKTYTCPACKEKQTTAIAVKNVDKTYIYDLNTQEMTEDNEFESDDCFEYCCPDCNTTLPYEITKNFNY